MAETPYNDVGAEGRKEFIRLVKVGLTQDYIWSDFVGGWYERDWPELSPEIRAQVSAWVKKYSEGELEWRRYGQPKERLSHYKQELRNILDVLAEGKPLKRSNLEGDIPF